MRGALALLAALASADCAHRSSEGSPTAAAPAADFDLVPSGAGAAAYGVAIPDGRGDPLRDAVREDVLRVARAEGVPPPLPDARLDHVADDLARAFPTDALPPAEAQDFLCTHYGLTEPPPHLLLAQATGGDDLGIRQVIAERLPATLRGGASRRLGIGVDRSGADLRVVVALQDRALDLKPVPRQLPRAGRAALAGRLLGGHIDPRLVLTAPDGSVRDLDVTGGADGFRGELRCGAGDGRYQVEVTGADASGTAVVANFPVYCGVEPPTKLSLHAGQRTAVPADAETALLRLVNADRTAAGLSPVVWDGRLADIARAHSRDMAEHDFVGHVSPRSGNAFDRVSKAGLRPTTVMENVGRAYSAEEAEHGFMASPGHRANLVDKRAQRLGVGVVAGPPSGVTTPLYVTQLFTD